MQAAERVVECCEVCEADDLVREHAEGVLKRTMSWLQAADPSLAAFDRNGLRMRRFQELRLRVLELRRTVEE